MQTRFMPRAEALPPPSLFTNYALVLMVISVDDKIRMREIAQRVGITERAVQRIVDELVTCGYLMATKSGRRNMYTINTSVRLQILSANNLRLGGVLGLACPTSEADPVHPERNPESVQLLT